ncbi:MAG: hypothetical protein IJ795_04140 [Bacteroidales bacterium]|nr:hypothetical protein [Bacteroidales bacterium]
MKHPAPLTAILASFSITLGLSAQDLGTVVRNDPSLAYNVYQPYTPGSPETIKAPRGFKPFYISHYGRHGSRYFTSEWYFSDGKAGLEALKGAGLLSEDGKRLYDEFEKLRLSHEKMYGELSPRGAREHRGISRRMYERFSRVFKDKSRRKVNCVSSTIPRCLVSMANFTSELKGNAPKLDFTFTTGQKYFELLCKEFAGNGNFENVAARTDSLYRADSRYDKFLSRICSDPEAARKVLQDPLSLAKGIYVAGCIGPCLDFLDVDLMKYFEPDELATFAIPMNNRIYGDFGNSYEWGPQVCAAAKQLVGDFVSKADKALEEGSEVAADLRFGHDSGIMPMLDLLEIKGYDVRCRFTEAEKYWYAHERIPMATNFQMIFYRNCKGEVLVRMLCNEAEATIDAVPAYDGSFYRWNDLREWFLAKSK